MRSRMEYSQNLWNPWIKNMRPVNQRKKERKIPLQGRLGVRRGSGSLALSSVRLEFCCLRRVSSSNQSRCISIFNYLQQMKKKSFLLPQPIIIQSDSEPTQIKQITYYSDCVFKPYIHVFSQSEVQFQENHRIKINFNFLLELTKKTPKVLDNIGVLKLNNNERYGILVTRQKQGHFVSLID